LFFLNVALAIPSQAVFEDRLRTVPIALPQMCCALDLYASPSKRQVVIAGSCSDDRALRLLQAAHSVYEQDKVVSLGRPFPKARPADSLTLLV
jgi:hypothetical protein